jgi:ABC-2 type transport system permease protein
MTASSYLVADTRTMLGRQLLHLRRYPSLTAFVVITPIVLLLLFVYVFGGMLGAGLGMAAVPSREAYLAYLTPGMLLIAVIGAINGTTIGVASDMNTGFVTRLRSMAISRTAVLTGHVVAGMVQTTIAVASVGLVAVLLGFRAATGPADWLAAVGLLLLVSFAFTWLGVALAMAAGSVETASNLPMLVMLLVIVSSGFVPTGSMPDALAWFADHQPITPLIETMRSLLLGTPGGDGLAAATWCVAISAVSAAFSVRRYNRDRVRA